MISDVIPDGPAAMGRFIESRREGLIHFFRTGVRAAGEALSPFTDLDRNAFATLCRRRFAEVDQLNKEVFAQLAKGGGAQVECQDRCAHCCYQHIAICSTEAFWLALTMPMAPQLWPTMVASAREVHDLSHAERFNRGIACPFLIDHRCSAYNSRPTPCRTHFSMRRAACEANEKVPYIAEPKLYGEAIAMGMDFGLMTVGDRPIQMVRGELAAMMAIALMRGAFEAWLNGDPIFPPDIFRPDTLPGISPQSYERALRAAASEAGVTVSEREPR